METRNEMTCAEMVEILSDYFDGALGADRMELCAGHLARCEACADYYRGLVYAIEVAGKLRSRPAAQTPADHLARFFRQRKNQ